jgi:nickel-type superoxide dismutase maturation protease
MIFLRRVAGKSMLPGLHPEQLVVVMRSRRIREGDVIMLRHDGLEKVKRVARVRGRKVFVVGDNAAASTDSTTFGWIDRSHIVGRVIWPRL